MLPLTNYLAKTIQPVEGDKKVWIEAVRKALLASKIISYAQGFMLIREASENFGWYINYGSTALLWREGCIIRSRFLGNIRDAYEANPDLIFLGSDSYFKGILENALSDWRKVVAKSIEVGYPNALYGISYYVLRWLYFSTFTGKLIASTT